MTTPPRDGAPLHPTLPVYQPQEPVPPRSRVPSRVAGTLTGLVVAPLAVSGMLVGAAGLMTWTRGGEHGEGLFLLGSLLFALWAILAGALSSLTLAVPALVWFVAVPLLVDDVGARVTGLVPPSFSEEARLAMDRFVSGDHLVLAALLLGAAVAIHGARRSGRLLEREESLAAVGNAAGSAAAPPTSRGRAHVWATASATVLAAVAGLAGLAIDEPAGVVAVTAVALGVAAALGGFSALAPLVAGSVGVLPQLVVHLEMAASGSSRTLEALAGSWGTALEAGTGWTSSAMLLLSFLGPWQARRVGRVLERAEITLSP